MKVNQRYRRVTLPHLLASYQGGLLYVLTVYPAESWAPRVRAHELRVIINDRVVCLSVRPSHFLPDQIHRGIRIHSYLLLFLGGQTLMGCLPFLATCLVISFKFNDYFICSSHVCFASQIIIIVLSWSAAAGRRHIKTLLGKAAKLVSPGTVDQLIIVADWSGVMSAGCTTGPIQAMDGRIICCCTISSR